jgi:hypothetical protein
MSESRASLRFSCGFCGEPTRAERSASLGRWNISAQQTIPDLTLTATNPLKFQFRDKHIVADDWPQFVNAICGECSLPNMFLVAELGLGQKVSPLLDGTYALRGRFEGSIIVHQWPNTSHSLSNKNIPARAMELFSETSEDQNRGRDAARIISTCRTILDICLKDLGEGSGSRKARIRKLHESGKITASMASWAGTLWDDGNDAVHDGAGDANGAREHIEFLRIFFEVCYALPNQITAARNPVADPESPK